MSRAERLTMSIAKRGGYARGKEGKEEPSQHPSSDSAGRLEASQSAADTGSVEARPLSFKARNFQRRRPAAEGRARIQRDLLAQQVGYVEVELFSYCHVLHAMPKLSVYANRVIPCRNAVCVIERGSVQIRHAGDKYPIKELQVGSVFGEMPVMGQAMLATEAVAGARGVTLTMLNPEQALRWIEADPHWWLAKLGPRLAEREALLYRIEFQPAESRIAALLLKLADGANVIEGMSRREMAATIGMYRETCSLVMNAMKALGIVALERMKVTILDEAALRELSRL